MLNNKLNLRKVVTIAICLASATTMCAQETGVVNNNVPCLSSNVDNEEYISENYEAYSENCSDNPIYQKMIALKERYPEGMKWTDVNRYEWKGGIYSWGTGCIGFAFILSDAAFGNSPARKHYDFNNLRIGDILRINNDSHSVIIICINRTSVTLAEGNYNSSIHWGRTFSIEDIKSKLDYVMTRYPK